MATVYSYELGQYKMEIDPREQHQGPALCQDGTNRLAKKKESLNPLQRGIKDFLTADLQPSLLKRHGLSMEMLHLALPKRFTAYEPMLLLSPNAFTVPPAWGTLYASLDTWQRQGYTYLS